MILKHFWGPLVKYKILQDLTYELLVLAFLDNLLQNLAKSCKILHGILTRVVMQLAHKSKISTH